MDGAPTPAGAIHTTTRLHPRHHEGPIHARTYGVIHAPHRAGPQAADEERSRAAAVTIAVVAAGDRHP